MLCEKKSMIKFVICVFFDKDIKKYIKIVSWSIVRIQYNRRVIRVKSCFQKLFHFYRLA